MVDPDAILQVGEVLLGRGIVAVQEVVQENDAVLPILVSGSEPLVVHEWPDVADAVVREVEIGQLGHPSEDRDIADVVLVKEQPFQVDEAREGRDVALVISAGVHFVVARNYL